MISGDANKKINYMYKVADNTLYDGFVSCNGQLLCNLDLYVL